MIGVVGLVYSVGARGGDWSITPSLSVSETFTDNANLATDDEDRNSDFITQVAPGVSVRGTGARGYLNLDYSLDQSIYHRDTRGDGTNNSLASNAHAELWDQIAFIDGRAWIAQVVDQPAEANSQSVTGRNVNRTETQALDISPYFRHHFGPWADTEARYRWSSVSTETDRIEDITTQSETLRITSGRRFTQLLWSLTALNSKTANEGNEPTERERRVDSDFTYVLNSKVSLLAGAGYEDIEDRGLANQPSGLTWNAGVALQPTVRTSLQFKTGERNGDTTYNFEGTHLLSERTSIRASYSESIQTSQRQISDNLAFLAVDPLTGEFIDNRTGLPFGTDDSFGLTEDTFRQKRFSLSVSGSRRRNSVSAQMFWEERETEATAVVETVYGGSVSLSRRVTPRLNGRVSASYRTTDFGTADERTEDHISASTSLNYQLGNDVQATLSYNLTLRNVNNAPDDLMENSVTVGLSKSF